MINVLVIGEKTSQVKKFVSTICRSYQSSKQGKYTYTYTGSAKLGSKNYNLTFLPLSGHITTLDTIKGYNWGECPPLKLVYDPQAIAVINKRKYVSILKKQINGKEELWLATDPDSEGDNIALEVVNILQSKLKRHHIQIKRIWNSSLTKAEIARAFLNPRPWSDKLGLAVQGRRLIDAWLGFAGTRELTRAARQVAKVKVLSVGRVQLPTLYLIVQRDLDHESFSSKTRWKLVAEFNTEKGQYTGEHEAGFFEEKNYVIEIQNKLSGILQAKVIDINLNKSSILPEIPLNTTAAVSLLSKIMKITADKALDLMVELYNQGLLSYPRTENKQFKSNFPHSSILSKLEKIREFTPLISTIKNRSRVRKNGPKKGEEEDHDPIHPTGETEALPKLDKQHRKAWDILTRYYISLFMDDQIIENQIITTLIDKERFVTKGRKELTSGWVLAQWWRKTRETIIPPLSTNQLVEVLSIDPKSNKTKPPKRLSDSNLILEMEKLNIGTKSSRPDIIKKLKKRNYVRQRKQQLISTNWGRALIASLAPIWPEIVTPQFTSHVEQLMDKVAKGEDTYEQMISQLKSEYIELHQDLLPRLYNYKKLLQQLNLSDQMKTSFNTEKINTILSKTLPKISS